MVFGINKNEEIIQFNRQCEKLTGYSRDEVLGKKIFNFLISKDEFVKWENLLDSIRKDSLVSDIVLQFLIKNGSKISVSCNTFPVENPGAADGDICFVGKLMSPDYSSDNSSIKTLNNLTETSSEPNDKSIGEIFSSDSNISQEKEDKQKSLNKIRSSAKEDIKNLFGRWLYSFFDTVGANKKKEELQAIARELDERRALLNVLEAELLEEKKELNERRFEFSKWRDKLDFLEKEIQDRWLELENQEKLFRDYIAYRKGLRLEHIKGDVGSFNASNLVDKNKDYHIVLDKTSECAAVIYRGILMQANSSFVELLGYEMDEVLGKSLFDFVAPENLDGIKKYYLNRLKGEAVSSFETFIVTRDNKKMNVEINIKSSSYNGEKANIVIIKNLMNKENK